MKITLTKSKKSHLKSKIFSECEICYHDTIVFGENLNIYICAIQEIPSPSLAVDKISSCMRAQYLLPEFTIADFCVLLYAKFIILF